VTQFGRKPTRSGAVRHLSVTVGGQGIEGKEVGEVAWFIGACERKAGKTRDSVGRHLFMAARRHGGEEKGMGVWLGSVWGRRMSYPVPRKRERSLYTCAQDVQITRTVII
jgi:hypothetical protein